MFNTLLNVAGINCTDPPDVVNGTRYLPSLGYYPYETDVSITDTCSPSCGSISEYGNLD